jgi:hypothetical protein
MNSISSFTPRFLSAPGYVFAIHEPSDHVVVLVRNRTQQQTLQRILPAETVASPPFQSWLHAQNLSGADTYVTWNRTGWFVLLFAASWFGLTRLHRTL